MGLELLELAPLAEDAPKAAIADAGPIPKRVESLLAFAVLAGALGLLGWTSWRAFLHTPYADAYDWVAQVFSTETTGRWLGYLWLPHTEQRIPIVRAVQAIDIEAGRGLFPTFLAATWLATLLGLLSLFGLIFRSPAAPRVKLWTAALAGLLLLNVAAAEDLAFPVFSVYLFVAGPALASIVFFEQAQDDGATKPFVLSLVFAALASLGNAAGLVIWPVLLAGAAAQGRPAAQVRAILAAGLVCVVAVEAGLGVPSRSFAAASTSGVEHVVKMLAYFGAYGGLPWTRALRPPAFAQAAGFCLELFAAATALRSLRVDAGPYAALRRTGALMIAFGLLTAVLAALGRVDELPKPLVPTRYFPFSALIQAGLVLCLAPQLRRFLSWRPKLSTAVLFTIGLVCLGLQLHGAGVLIRNADRFRAADHSFDPAVQALVYPDPAKAAAIRSELKARGLPY